MKKKHLRLGTAGDTIVEVLIALAVVGAVLGGAYSVASRALRNGRSAQERVEALKIAEGQIEWLKYYARNDGQFNTNYRTNSYCFDQSNGTKLAANAPGCTVGLYNLNITYVPDATFSNPAELFGTFSITVIWDRLGGGVNEELIINYQS